MGPFTMTVFIAEESFFVKADTFLCKTTVPRGAEKQGECRMAKAIFQQTGSAQKSPVVQSIVYPEYQGALVLCEGADRAGVRLAVIEAVSSLTGLGSNKIAVVKLKGQ